MKKRNPQQRSDEFPWGFYHVKKDNNRILKRINPQINKKSLPKGVFMKKFAEKVGLEPTRSFRHQLRRMGRFRLRSTSLFKKLYYISRQSIVRANDL